MHISSGHWYISTLLEQQTTQAQEKGTDLLS